jgi:hypothetical protein
MTTSHNLRTEVPVNPQPHIEVPADPLALTFLVLFAASEVIGSSSKIKSNSIIQLIVRLINNFKPARKEDEIVTELRHEITELTETVQKLQATVRPFRTTRSSDN